MASADRVACAAWTVDVFGPVSTPVMAIAPPLEGSQGP